MLSMCRRVSSLFQWLGQAFSLSCCSSLLLEMRNRHCLFTSTLAFGVAVTLIVPVWAAAVSGASARNEAAEPNTVGLLQIADARSYRHCHNLPRRTYCHKGEPLPTNWPPNTNTPGRLQKPYWHNKKRRRH